MGEGKAGWLTGVPLPQNANCHKKIDELFSGKLYLIGIAAVVVAVIMVSVTREKPPWGTLVLFQLGWIYPSLDAPETLHAAPA